MNFSEPVTQTLIDDFLQEIKKGCDHCPWKDRKSHTVPPEGPWDSPLMMVGRNPGFFEDKEGRPFVGPAGKARDRFITDSGVLRSKIYTTNTAKCYGGAGDPCPTEEVFDCCECMLNSEISIVRPRLIVPFGSDAYRRLTGDTAPISVVQGKVTDFRHQPGRLYFPLTHPSFWIRTQGYYEKTILPKVIPEFQRVLRDLMILDDLT